MTTGFTPSIEDRKTREVRLGLVMYGGVSLAIYINGVAHEFFRAVRGRGVYKLIKALTDSDIVVDIISGTSAGGINGILLAYALCNDKDFSSSATLWRRDGDIRSLLRSPNKDLDGAHSLLDSEGYYQPRLEEAFQYMPAYVPESEGEINSTFDELDLFVTGTDVDGNVSTRFDDAGHPIDVKDHRSVFLLKHRKRRKEPFNPRPDYMPHWNEGVTYRSLAKLARITSCFPAAFAPVLVTEDGSEEDRLLQTWGLLRKEACFLDGGVLDNKPFTHTLIEIFNRSANCRIDRKLFYVEPDPEHLSRLDSASQPNFLQAIIASLIGIPGYESISDDLKLLANHNSKVNRYRRLTTSLSTAKTSAAGSAKKIKASAKEIRKLYIPSRLIAISDRVVEGLLNTNGRREALDHEERKTAAELIKTFDKMWENQVSAYEIISEFDIYFRLRRLFHVTYAIEKKLRKPDNPKNEQYRQLWAALNQQIKLLDMVRAKMESLIDSIPIEWKKGIARAMKQDAIDSASPQKKEEGKDAAVAKEAADGDNPNKKKEKKISAVEKEAAAIWHTAEAAMRKLLHENAELLEMIPSGLASSLKTKGQIWPDQQHLTDINIKLTSLSKEIITDMREGRFSDESIRPAQNLFKRASLPKEKIIDIREGRFSDESTRPAQNLFNKTDAHEQCLFTSILGDSPDPIRGAYEGFLSLDIHLFPLELMSDLREKDVIETIRISPRDAEKGFSNKGLSDKVSGDSLYHFGGFFKRSWRSNDILWGRLDGLCQLIETLLTQDLLKEITEDINWRNRVRGFLLENPSAPNKDVQWKAALDPVNLFPQAGEKTHKRLKNWLLELLSKNKGNRDNALEKERFDEMIGLLVEAAQLEILYEEVPNVITDALAEQGKWNQFQLSIDKQEQALDHKRKSARKRADDAEMNESGPNPFSYESANGSLDPFVAIIAATGRTEDVMGNLRDNKANAPATPSQTKLGRFFKNQYQVGREELLRDMPQIILLEILSVSLLVLRNCILGIFGDRAAKIKDHPLYKFTVDYPLRIFYRVVMFMRGAPRSWKFALAGLAIISVLLLFVGVTWHASILYSKDVFSFLWFTVFIAAPVIVLVTEAVFLSKGRLVGSNRTRTASWIIKSFFIAVCIVATYLLVVSVFVGAESFNKLLQASIMERLPDFFPGFSTFAPEYQNWIAKAITITVYLLALLLPSLGVMWLIRLKKPRSADKKSLKQALMDYFTTLDIERIARKLVESEMIRRESLDMRLSSYMRKNEIAEVKKRIRASEEVESARLEEALRNYATSDKMKKIAKRLDTFLEPKSYWLRNLRKISHRISNNTQLVEVLKDYAGENADRLNDLVDAVKKSAPAEQNKWLPNIARIVERIQLSLSARNRQRFPCQRRLINGETVKCFGLRATLEDQLSIDSLTRVIAARLGIKRPKKKGRRSRGYDDFQRAVAKRLDVKEATRSAMNSLEGARLIEYAKLRRIVEEQLNIIQVVSLIKEKLGQTETIEWEKVEKILPDYAGERETQQIAEDLLASLEVVWDMKGGMREEFDARLKNYFSDGDDIKKINERLQELNRDIAWVELREILKGFVSEDEVRKIAVNLVSSFAFSWRKWEGSLRQHLTIASLMSRITGKLTSLGQSPADRKAFAEEVVDYANRNGMLASLESQMRFINSEALYYG